MNALTDRLQHWLIVPVLVLFVACIQIAFWAFDREPPFEVLSSEITSAEPGRVVVLKQVVRREPERRCSADFTRSIYDSTGARFDLEGANFATAKTIDALEKFSPGGLTLAVIVPVGAQLGPATLVTTLRYRCNPLHALWPIDVIAVVPFNVR